VYVLHGSEAEGSQCFAATLSQNKERPRMISIREGQDDASLCIMPL
jgi:hypothetical protein